LPSIRTIKQVRIVLSYSSSDEIKTHAAQALKSTDIIAAIIVGALSLSVGDSRQSEPNDHIIQISVDALKTLNSAALIDMGTLQNILGSDGVQPSFFHFVLYWLKFWIGETFEAGRRENVLFEELMGLVGYAILGCERNRTMLRFGSAPSILQLLVKQIPFAWFIEEGKRDVLFPVLVAAVWEDEANAGIVMEDVGLGMLIRWGEERVGKDKGMFGEGLGAVVKDLKNLL
jgi:hypothetical protein